MANLIVSTVCNQNCAYCFTADRFGRDGTSRAAKVTLFLSLDAFQDRLDFLARSNLDEVRLLGGEPTLHPDFDVLVARALRSGKRVTVFTNGLMPATALACLVALPPSKCQVVVNVNAPAAGAVDTVAARQREVLGQLGVRARLGFNIHRTDFRPEFLLQWIAETGCEPVIRFGIAHPSLSGANNHIQPGQYRAIAARLVPFVKKAADAGVRVGFDCGFVRCMFSPAELVDLAAAGVDRGWHCSPILDVDLDNTVLHCFPLATLAVLPFTPAVDATALHSEFQERRRPYRRAGVYRECSTCAYRTAGECAGGCLSVTIRRFRHTPLRVEIPDLTAPHYAAGTAARPRDAVAHPPAHLGWRPSLSGGASS